LASGEHTRLEEDAKGNKTRCTEETVSSTIKVQFGAIDGYRGGSRFAFHSTLGHPDSGVKRHLINIKFKTYLSLYFVAFRII
jgi:hypothetical protein